MPLHCNKATVFFFLKTFYRTLFLAFILFLASLLDSQAQTPSAKADLTFITSNYTRCDSLLIQIQVATDQDFLKLVEQSSWMACRPKTNFTYSAYLPVLQGSFYWRGRHQDKCSGEISAWSSPFRFYLLVDSTKVVGGDANGDGLVSLQDFIYLAEYFFRAGPPPTPPQAGDVNCDGNCSVGDVIYLINYMWKNGPNPCKPLFKPVNLERSSLSSQQPAR